MMFLGRLWNRWKSAFFRAFRPDTPPGRRARLEKHCRRALEAKNQGRFSQAERELEKALGILESPWPQDLLLANSLASLGETLEDFGKYAQAARHYRQALSVKEELLGVNHPDLAIELNNLGLILYEQGRYPPAQEIFQRLLPLLEENHSLGKRQLSICLENYAAVLRRLGEDERSTQLLSRARSIRNETFLGRGST